MQSAQSILRDERQSNSMLHTIGVEEEHVEGIRDSFAQAMRQTFFVAKLPTCVKQRPGLILSRRFGCCPTKKFICRNSFNLKQTATYQVLISAVYSSDKKTILERPKLNGGAQHFLVLGWLYVRIGYACVPVAERHKKGIDARCQLSACADCIAAHLLLARFYRIEKQCFAAISAVRLWMRLLKLLDEESEVGNQRVGAESLLCMQM